MGREDPPPEEKKLVERRPAESADAYDFFVRARRHRKETGNYRNIEPMLQNAEKLDPKFALAWADLAWIHGRFYATYVDRTPERAAKAKAAIDTAVGLAPEEPDVVLNLGYYHYFCGRDYVLAGEQFAQVARLQPNAAAPIYARALLCRRQGRWAEALVDDPKNNAPLF